MDESLGDKLKIVEERLQHVETDFAYIKRDVEDFRKIKEWGLQLLLVGAIGGLAYLLLKAIKIVP